MKVTRKITRVKLQIDQINDFVLFGFVSSEPDYKLSLTLNKKFSISLKNNNPVKIEGDNGTEQLFSKFSDSSDSPDRVFNLVTNRSGNQFLIKKLVNIDYIFHVHDPEMINNITLLTSSLREISSITAVFNIDLDSIKDKNLHFVIQ